MANVVWDPNPQAAIERRRRVQQILPRLQRGTEDVRLMMNNGQFVVAHRHVLSMGSAFFEALLSRPECSGNIIRLDKDTRNEVHEYVHYIYNGELRYLATLQLAMNVYELAFDNHEHLMVPLCRDMLLRYHLKEHTCVQIFLFGLEFRDSQLIRAARQYLRAFQIPEPSREINN